MAKVLVCYYSKTNHTAEMAKVIGEGAGGVKGAEADVKSIHDVEAKNLQAYDAVVVGSPTYYGTMAAEIKELLDASVAFHGKLKGRVGGAFTSSGNLAGGGETTILAILQALMIHGMVVQGTPKGAHYGPVAIGKMDERARKECLDYGQMIAELAVKLHG